MKLDILHIDERIPQSVANTVISEVSKSLSSIVTTEDKFVINDTKWLWLTPKNTLKPSVVNSAKYITESLKDYLKDNNWEPEKTLNGQRIDGYREIEIGIDSYQIEEDDYIELLKALKESGNSNYGNIATMIYKSYVTSSKPYLMPDLKSFESLFKKRNVTGNYCIGLEFETGNIASSFRALQKLDSLYDLNLIQAGVFITSIDKQRCATRIWPSSNRNGSFEELRNRNYTENRRYPSIDIAFQPDAFSSTAPYLAENGDTYQMENETLVTIDSNEYIKAIGFDGVEKYRLP